MVDSTRNIAESSDETVAPTEEQVQRLAAWLVAEPSNGWECVDCPLGTLLGDPADVANDPGEAYYQCEVLGRVWGEYAPCEDDRARWFLHSAAAPGNARSPERHVDHPDHGYEDERSSWSTSRESSDAE